MGFVNINDQYRLNSSKSKRPGNSTSNWINSSLKVTSSKQRSNSNDSNEK